jgi:DNA-binding transcriptional ArsR family regulator
MDLIIPSERTAARADREANVAAKPKFTRIPKIPDLVAQGVPTEAIPTYCCLADHANNKSGLCWPKMETLAAILKRSVRTIQRHLHTLKELGLIEFVERRRHRGRFSSYIYKILHIVTTGHTKPVASKRRIYRGTKQTTNTPKSPTKDRLEGYWWLFGEDAPPGEQEEREREQKEKREETAKRRTEGYEWFFR